MMETTNMKNNEANIFTPPTEVKKIEPKLDVLLREFSYELCRQRDNVVELRRANNRFGSSLTEVDDHDDQIEPQGVIDRLEDYIAEFKAQNDEFTSEVENLLLVI